MRTLRLLLGAAGLALTGYGLSGLLTDPYVTGPPGVLAWAVGGLLLHDGLWMPLVCLTGATLARTTPVRTGLVTAAAAVTAVALPAVLRAGDDGGNSSVLPLPYLRNWLLTLAAVAALTLLGAAAVAAGRRRGRGKPPAGRPGPPAP